MEGAAQAHCSAHVPVDGWGTIANEVMWSTVELLITCTPNTAICNFVCDNGDCTQPGQCTCHPGWTGDNCTQGKERGRTYTEFMSHVFIPYQPCVTLNVPITGLAPAPMFATALRNGVETTAQTVKEQVPFTTWLLTNVFPPPPSPLPPQLCATPCVQMEELVLFFMNACVLKGGWEVAA